MSASTQLNLQHDQLKQPALAVLVALAAICAAVIVFNSLAGAESGNGSANAPASSNKATSSVNVDVHSSSHSDGANNSSSSSVNVNGQNIETDENGSVDKTITSEDGSSRVHVKIDNQAGGTGDESL